MYVDMIGMNVFRSEALLSWSGIQKNHKRDVGLIQLGDRIGLIFCCEMQMLEDVLPSILELQSYSFLW